jgi:hypothetical protein
MILESADYVTLNFSLHRHQNVATGQKKKDINIETSESRLRLLGILDEFPRKASGSGNGIGLGAAAEG